MYNVLIVEDDAIVRKYLKNIIDWQSLDLKIAGEAKNGLEAREFIDRNNVDIVITDISMPLQNGVELIKHIKNTNKHIKTIALSCYENYGFIREALKYGAEDYILKQQLNENEFAELLEKVKSSLAAEREKANEKLELDRIIKTNIFVNLEDEKSLLDYIMDGNAKDAEEIVGGYIRRLENSGSTASSAKMHLLDLFNIINRAALKCEVSFLELFGVDYIPYGEIEQKGSLHEIQDWLYSLIDSICKCSVRHDMSKRNEILMALKYIKANYKDDINLLSVSRHVGLSPNYFSALFKKETGKSFSEYLLNLRLEEARTMLRNADVKVYEVAYKCGFGNNQYFNRIFKEKYDVTPLFYKRNHNRI